MSGYELWRTNPVLARLPPEYRTVRYVGARYPGSPAVEARPRIGHGANCQLFAYHVRVPVSRADLLDLVLFGTDSTAWGAHVGVWVEDGQVLHLSAEVGRPAVWSVGEFAACGRYRTVVGVKRVRARTGRWGNAGSP